MTTTAAPSIPFVTVIVPTYNRANLLPYLLEALALQDYAADRFEVIFVDNTSSDSTPELVAAWQDTVPFAVRFVQKENRGPAPSRNLGARLARGDVLAFTDSDCAPLPGWIRAGATTLASDPSIGIVLGPVRPLSLLRDLNDLPMPSRFLWIEKETYLYETANIFYRKEDFWTAGGFPEDYTFEMLGYLQGGDDTELGWKVKRLGFRSVFLSEAAILHAIVRIGWRDWFKQVLAFAPLPLILRRCPEASSFLTFGFLMPFAGAPLFKLALLALPLAWISPLALLVTLPFLWYWTFKAYPSDVKRPWRWPALAFKVAAWSAWHLALFGVMVASSVRHRRVVI
jgi:glycosyltransferase involved in cell wall biosynthesis